MPQKIYKHAYSFVNTVTTIQLSISLPKHLPTALISVDVHPTYVEVGVKGRVMRLLWEEEVSSSDAVVQRSLSSGALVITAAKAGVNVDVAGEIKKGLVRIGQSVRLLLKMLD